MENPTIKTRRRLTKKKKKKIKAKTVIISLISFIVAMPLVAWLLVEMWLNSWTGLFNFGDSNTSRNFNPIDAESGEFIDDDINAYKPPEIDVYKDEDVLNVLMIGTDERQKDFDPTARSDSMMILSLNFKTNTIRLASLARNIPVYVPELGKNDLLTHIHHYGGEDMLLEYVRSYLGVDVDKYVRTNFYTFEKLIDSVGGVDVELTYDEALGLNGEHPLGSNAITKARVKEGSNHLSGYDALQYSRLRYIDDDYHRIVRQRNVVMSVIKSAKGMSLNELNKMLQTVAPLVKTNFTQNEIKSVVYRLVDFLTGADIENISIPENNQVMINKEYSHEKYSQVLRDFLYQ